MRNRYTMMSPSVTSLIEEEGTEVDGADRDGAEREGGATESNYRDLNYTSLRLTVTASMAHMKEKWSEKGKETKKWHKIRVIAKGKMSLLLVAISLNTSIMERIKCKGKSIVSYFNKESKNRAQGSVIEL